MAEQLQLEVSLAYLEDPNEMILLSLPVSKLSWPKKLNTATNTTLYIHSIYIYIYIYI